MTHNITTFIVLYYLILPRSVSYSKMQSFQKQSYLLLSNMYIK